MDELCSHCDTPLLTEVERARIKDLEAINQSHKELNGKLSAQLANQLTAEEADFLVNKINWCVGCIDNIKRPSCVDTCVPGLVAKLKAQAELEQAISDLDQASKCLKCVPANLEECRICEGE